MKQIQKTLCGCLCFLLVLSLAGCGSRTAVTEETFTSVMKELKYTEQEMDESSVLLAKSNGVESYKIFITDAAGSAAYCVYSDTESARKAYADMVSAMGSQDAKKEKEVDSATYNRAEFSGAGGLLVIIRTDSTLLTVSDSEATVKDILKRLGV